MQPRYLYATLAVVICVLLVATLIRTPQQHVALLERLAPRIERAQILAPETSDAIMRVVDRVRETAGDPRQSERRQLAIQRVTDALNAKNEPGNVGQGASAR